MKFSLKMATAALAVVGAAAGVAHAQSASVGNPAVSSANATVTVIEPISITAPVDLVFGSIVADDVSYTATMAAAPNSHTSVPGAAPEPLDVSLSHAGSFTISADDNHGWTASVDPSVNLSDGTNSMLLTTATSVTSFTGDTTLYVGGDLDVAADQAPGNYTGVINISVNYD